MFLRTLAIALLISPTAQAFQVGTSTATRTKPVVALKAHAEGQDDDGRRAFMATGMAAVASLMLPQMPANADGGVDYKAVAKDIMKLVEKNPDWGPSKSCIIFYLCVCACHVNIRASWSWVTIINSESNSLLLHAIFMNTVL